MAESTGTAHSQEEKKGERRKEKEDMASPSSFIVVVLDPHFSVSVFQCFSIFPDLDSPLFKVRSGECGVRSLLSRRRKKG
jgi:hypothetical protein